MMWTTSAATYLCTKPSAWTAPASWWLTTMPPASPRSWSTRTARRISFSTTASCVMCPAGQQRAAVHRVWCVLFHYRRVEVLESIEDVDKEIMWLMKISVTRKRFHMIDKWWALPTWYIPLHYFLYIYIFISFDQNRSAFVFKCCMKLEFWSQDALPNITQREGGKL